MTRETLKSIISQLIVTDKVVFGAIYLTCGVYTKTIIHFGVGESGGRTVLSFSPPHSADVLNVLGYTITIDFDDMLMTLRPLDSQDTLISELRRLPTLNGPVDPSEPTSMSSTWFWEDNGNVWRTYDKDCSVR